jgi:hypothetical protein
MVQGERNATFAIIFKGSFWKNIFPFADLCWLDGIPHFMRILSCIFRSESKDGTSCAPPSRKTQRNTFISEFEIRRRGRLSIVSSKNICINLAMRHIKDGMYIMAYHFRAIWMPLTVQGSFRVVEI